MGRMIRKDRQRRLILIAAILMAAVSAIALLPASVVQALSRLGIPIVSTLPVAIPAKPAAQGEQPTFLVIYATTSGFEPKEIITRPGQHLIMIRNRSGLDNITYKVIDDKETDATKKEKFKAKTTVGANALTRLPLGVGEFLVLDESDPENICRIKVEP